jgi:hypothetical protein
MNRSCVLFGVGPQRLVLLERRFHDCDAAQSLRRLVQKLLSQGLGDLDSAVLDKPPRSSPAARRTWSAGFPRGLRDQSVVSSWSCASLVFVKSNRSDRALKSLVAERLWHHPLMLDWKQTQLTFGSERCGCNGWPRNPCTHGRVVAVVSKDQVPSSSHFS